MRRTVREHLREFVAIVVLFVFGLLTAGVILSKQQAPYPSWVPILGDDTFQLEAEFETAQAVTPGQGQTVNLAGIKVGDVTETRLEEGRAVVTMLIEQQYAPLIHDDASLLLRPRTGLQDMTVEVEPGSDSAPAIGEGALVPLAQTEPNVNTDQILASLDGDTQDYLRLLIQGGGEGLGERGERLSAGLRRFEPLSRHLARLNGGLAKRREAIRHAITSFKLVSEELGSADARLAAFVDSSDSVLGSFARQEASIRGALQELPSALAETRGAIESSDRFALELGPAARALIPSAQALKPALEQTQPFLRDTVEPIREQIRPFTRQVREPISALRGAARQLNRSAPVLQQGLGELNRVFNALAFNPEGPDEGYLFWAAWLSHDTNGLFTLQDADGPTRRALIMQSCQTASLAEGTAASFPLLKTLIEATRIPTSATICPLDP